MGGCAFYGSGRRYTIREPYSFPVSWRPRRYLLQFLLFDSAGPYPIAPVKIPRSSVGIDALRLSLSALLRGDADQSPHRLEVK